MADATRRPRAESATATLPEPDLPRDVREEALRYLREVLTAGESPIGDINERQVEGLGGEAAAVSTRELSTAEAPGIAQLEAELGALGARLALVERDLENMCPMFGVRPSGSPRAHLRVVE